MDMERVKKYCRAVQKLYAAEGITSSKAAAQRKKLRECIATLEDDATREEALEKAWLDVYYTPLRAEKPSDEFRLVVAIFAGELLQLPASPSIFVYVGDLHRYMWTEEGSALARQYYLRALAEDPSCGRPLNQLSLTQEPLPAVRSLLYSLLSEKPFLSAYRNLEGRIAKGEDAKKSPFFGILQAAMSTKQAPSEPSKVRKSAAEQWLASIGAPAPSGGDTVVAEGNETVTQTHCLALAVAVCQVDASAGLVSLVGDALLRLLVGGRAAAKAEEEEDDVKVARRRRQLSDSEEEFVEKERVRERRRRSSDDEDDSQRNATKDKASAELTLEQLNALAVALEWIGKVDGVRSAKENEGDCHYATTRSMKERMKFDELVRAVTDRINRVQFQTDEMALLVAADAAATRRALAAWLSTMPPSKGMAQRTIALHLARIIRAEEGSIVLSASEEVAKSTSATSVTSARSTGGGLFVPRTRMDASMLRRMAALHMESSKNSRQEHPNTLILKAECLERRLGKVRALVERSHQEWILPASELALLDTRKGVSKAVRDALRFVADQQHGRIRVMPSGDMKEAVERALKRPPVVVLAMQTDKEESGLPAGVTIQHVDEYAQFARG